MKGHSQFADGHVRKLVVGAALAALLMLTLAGGANAKVVWRHGHAYGELPKPGSQPALSFTGSPFTVGGNQPPLTYGGGPVMLSSKIYLIFWGKSGSFASSYSGPIIQWVKDLAADHAKTSNEFSVNQLYYSGTSTHHFITNNIIYGGSVFDTSSYGAIDTAGGCDAADAPCVTDNQMQNEILNEINAQGWPTDPASAPEAQYMVFTPSGVNSCDGPGSCTFSADNGYCAYHSQVTGITPGNQVATYSNMPYESACDSGQAPTGTQHNADTDGTLDSGIHEISESATDPAGNAWLDSGGQEIGDKCTNPVVTTTAATYGTPLGGLPASRTAYNQLINNHTYYTQMLWANNPTQTPKTTAAAGCVQRIGPSPVITMSAFPKAGQSVTYIGSGSTDIQHPITKYSWNFGDGTTATGITAKHTFAAAGNHTVTLAVTDGYGSPSTQARQVTVTG
jgi:PKD domain